MFRLYIYRNILQFRKGGVKFFLNMEGVKICYNDRKVQRSTEYCIENTGSHDNHSRYQHGPDLDNAIPNLSLMHIALSRRRR